MPATRTAVLLMLLALGGAARAEGQIDTDAVRSVTRQQLEELLAQYGPAQEMHFHRSTVQPFNLVGSLSSGLTNSSSLEIIVSIGKAQTIGFRIYPHYAGGGYINIDKVRNGTALMRKLLQFTDRNFLFWGADDTYDVFAGYSFTLESGFPAEALKVVISSIANLDRFVGELKPVIDGTEAPSH
jgi:hypothetical protein